MAKNLKLDMQITADTSQAKREMKELQDQLSKLGTGVTSMTAIKGMTSDIKQATQMVAQLKVQLEQATNVETGKLDWTKFNQGLKQSKTSLGDYRKALQSLGAEGTQAFAQLAKSIATSEVPVLRIGERLKALGITLKNTLRWQISSTVLHGFMSSISTAYNYSKDLNESLNNIRIVTGLDVEAMSKFADEANKAAQSLGTSTTAYTDAALIYYQQGIRDEEQIKARTDATIKLANVTKTSAEEVSSQLTAIWNNFAKDGDENLELYADKITALGAATASSSAEIAQGLEKFAAIADTVGLSYDYATAGLATVVAQTRQSADIVGTAFKTIFGRMESLKLGETLEDDTTLKDYSKALQQVGVDIKDANGELRNMDDVLDELGGRWKDLNKDQQVALAQTVAGVRQYNQFIALLDNWDKVQKNVRVAEGAEGTLQRQQNIYEESWEASAKKVKAAWEAVYTDILEDDFFIELNNNLASLLKTIDKIIDNMGGVKGLLLQIAPIVMQIFSKDIINGMESAALNWQLLRPNGRQKIIDKRDKELERELGQAEETLQKGGMGSKQIEEVKEDIRLEQIRVKYGEELNDTNKAILNTLLDQIKAHKDAKKAIEEEIEETKRMAKVSAANEAKALGKNGLIRNKTIEDEITARAALEEESQKGQQYGALNILKEQYITDAGADIKNVDKQAAEIMLNTINAIKERYSQAFDNLNVEDVEKGLKEIVETGTTNLGGPIKTFFENLKIKMDDELNKDGDLFNSLKLNTGPSFKGIDANRKITRSLKDNWLKNQDQDFGKGSKDAITIAFNNYIKEIDESKGDFDKQQKALEKLEEALGGITDKSNKVAAEEGSIAGLLKQERERIQAGLNVQNGAQNVRDEGMARGDNIISETLKGQPQTSNDAEKMAEELARRQREAQLRWSESIYATTRAFMTLASTISTVKSTLATLTDESASFGDKVGAVFQGLITLSMQYSMLLRGNTAELMKKLFFVQAATAAEEKDTESKIKNGEAALENAEANKVETSVKAEQIPVNEANAASEETNTAGKGTAKGGKVFSKLGLFSSKGSGALSTAGVAAGWIAAIIAAIVAFIAALKWKSDELDKETQELKRKNEENVKWFEDNKLLADASSNYDHLNKQLKNNVISTDEFNKSLVELGKQLGIVEAETAEATESYELLNYLIQQEQEKINKEAMPKAIEIDTDTRNLMTAGISMNDAFWNAADGPVWRKFKGNYNSNNYLNTFKIAGAGAEIETGEEAVLKKIADLNLKSIAVNQELGGIGFDVQTASTRDLYEFSKAVAEIVANEDKYGGEDNELIQALKEMTDDWEGIAQDFKIALDQEEIALVRTELNNKTIDSVGEYLTKYYDLTTNKNITGESARTSLSEVAQGDVNTKGGSVVSFLESQNYNEKELAAIVNQFSGLGKSQQDLIAEGINKNPEIISSIIKSHLLAGTKFVEEDFIMIQSILDSIDLANFETTFTTVQETLDNLTVGQVFKTEKEFESFAKKFGKTADEMKAAYKDAFVFYEDGSAAFVGNIKKLQKDYMQGVINNYREAQKNLDVNKKNEKELLQRAGQKDATKYIEDLTTQKTEKEAEIKELIKNKSSLLSLDEVDNLEQKEVELGGRFSGTSITAYTEEDLKKAFGEKFLEFIENYKVELDDGKIGYNIGEKDLKKKIENYNSPTNKEKEEAEIAQYQSELAKINAELETISSLHGAIELGSKSFNEAIEGFDFANAGMNLDELEAIYQEARDLSGEFMGNVTDAQGAMKQASVNTMKELKMTDEEIEGYVTHLKESVASLKTASEDQIYAFAASLSRLQKGIQDLHDNWDDWSKALKEKNNEKYVKQYSDALINVQNALKNVFDIDTNVSEDFILSHLKDIKKAATGSKEAIQKLSREYIEQTFTVSSNTPQILASLSDFDKETYNTVDDVIKKLDQLDDSFEFGMTLDTSAFMVNLVKALDEAGWTVKQINDLLSAAQWKGELKEDENGVVFGFENITYSGGKMTPTDKKKSSGKKKSSKNRNADRKDELERYYTINRQIQDQTDLLDHLSKAKDRAWGNAKLQLMDKESKALKEQIKLYQKKQKEIESYYKQDQARMNWYGARYDENGVITNYKQLQKREENRYNTAAKKYEKGQISEKAWEKAKNRYEQFEKDLQQYDDTNQLYQQHLEELNDLKNELFDKKLEKIDTKIQMHIQVDDMELKMLEYELDRTKKKAFSTAEAISKALSEIDIYKDEGKTYKSGINSVLKQFGISLKDIDSLSDKKISKLGLTQGSVDQLTAYADAILEDIKAIDELEETILNGPLDVMKEWNAEFDYQEDKIANNINLMKEYQNISELIYSTTPEVDDQFIYNLMESQFTQGVSATAAAQAELESNKKLLAEARASYEAALTDPTKTDQNRTQLRDNLREMEKIVQQSENNVLKSIDDTVKKAQEILKQAVDIAANDFKKALDVSDWDMTQFERLKKLDDEYLDDYEKIYEFSKLTRDINNSIDDADTIRQKERLREITQEIADIEASGKEVSQYEVDALRKKYELRLAEIALEDAQAAKSTVRMSRDNDGNWSYVYTADNDNIDKALQNYEDKLYAYQKLNSEFIKKQEEDFRKLEIEAAKALSEIYSATDLKEEEKTQRAEETKAFYAQMLGISTDQLSIALEKNSELYHKDWLDYSENTGYKISKLEDYQNSIEYTYDGVLQPTIKSATDLLDQFQTYVSGDGGFYAKLDNALKQYHTNVETVLNAAGTDYKNFAKDVNAALVTTETESKKASKQVVTDTAKMEKAFEKVIAEVNKLNGQKLSNLRTQLNNTYKDVQKLLSAYEKLGQAAKESNKTSKTNSKNSPSGGTSGGGGGGGGSKKTKDDNDTPTDLQLSLGNTASNLAQWMPQFVDNIKELSNAIGINTFLKAAIGATGQKGMALFSSSVSMLKGSNKAADKVANNESALKQARAMAKWLTKNKLIPSSLPSFNTGGYTGSWGSEGRLAMLHQKELVLNAHDTENMLNTIQMVRDIVASIDTRAAAASVANISAGYAGAATTGPQDLNQNVHIEANFPNATDHNEIELALSSLVNRASQYVGRKKL